MHREASLFQRSVEPLVHAHWPLFVGWSVAVAALWCAGEGWVDAIANPGLRAGVDFIVHAADAAWLLLAALNVYLGLAEREGIRHARFVAVVTLAVAAAIGWSSVRFGQPLGSVAFTSRLGARLGPVPVGWVFLWFAFVHGGRALVAKIWPRLSHGNVALAVGLLALLSTMHLESLATRLRLFWFWYAPGTTTPAAAPWQNFATWFLAATALAWIAREGRVISRRPISMREAAVMVILNAVFVVGHLRLWWASRA